ncbi:MAG: DEAD/DEAH box helicase [Vicingaceae bacterium]|nr:DEAD/DEAH box helicase [Vicingaceae bacterium]
MSFDSLGLSAPLLKAVAKKGYAEPSPIQEKAIPVVLQGKDVLASAQTGTGKTAGFTLPILQLLSQTQQSHKRQIRALVLTPTRELAAQIFDNVKEYSEFIDFRSAVIFGGVNQNPQIKAIKNGLDLLVATPGRLLDLHNQGHLSLSNIEILVLDEADRMLDMGFLRDIKRIMELLPKRRQNLLFSATFSKDIKKLANSILYQPVMVEATPENTTAEKVSQRGYKVDRGRKAELVIKLISEGNWSQVLIFMRTKHGANNLTKKLLKKNITAAAIHGNKTQGARVKALSDFKSGKIRVLVATDIAARGLDIPLLPHVINYELPNIPEDYVHRIGRTGRAGASGQAISLIDFEEYEYVRGIEKLLGEKLQSETVPGFDLENIPSPPKQERGRRNPNKPKKKQGGGNRNGNNNRGNRR